MTAATYPGGPAEERGARVVPLYESAATRVVLVDDHELLGQILVHALEAAGIDAVLVPEPSATAVAECVARFGPDVALLDLDLGERYGTGLRLIPKMTEVGASVIMLTGSKDRLALAECIEAGASAVVGKDEPLEHLLEAIQQAASGRSMAADARHALLQELWACRAEATERQKPFQRLTRREGQVLAALSEGNSAAEIAEQDFVSLATVRTQIRGVLIKLGVTSQLAAVALARQSGWSLD